MFYERASQVLAAETHIYLEGPQEVGSIFEVVSNSEDFMDQIFHTDDISLAQFSLDNVVAGERNTTSSALGEPALVDQVTHALQVGVSIRNVGLANAEHVHGSLTPQ